MCVRMNVDVTRSFCYTESACYVRLYMRHPRESPESHTSDGFREIAGMCEHAAHVEKCDEDRVGSQIVFGYCNDVCECVYITIPLHSLTHIITVSALICVHTYSYV